jgi:hypothetical protein
VDCGEEIPGGFVVAGGDSAVLLGRLVMVSPVSRQSSPLSGRKSTYPPVQIPEASSTPQTNAATSSPPQDMTSLDHPTL